MIVTHQADTPERSATLRADMSLSEALSAVAGGAVTYECRDAGDHINLWTDSATGVRVTPWCRAGKGLDLALYRGLVDIRRDLGVVLTALGRRRLNQLQCLARR